MTAKLTIEQYVPLACVTETPPGSVLSNILKPGKHLNLADFEERPIRLLHAALGMTEVAELWEQHHKAKTVKAFQLDRENIFEEIGDCFWYTAIFRDAYSELFQPATEGMLTRGLITGKKSNSNGYHFRLVTIAAGKLLDVAKKSLFYDRKYTDDQLRAVFYELEDSLHGLCFHFGFDADEVRGANIRKLHVRYGDKFSNAAANNRDIATEMEALGFDQ